MKHQFKTLVAVTVLCGVAGTLIAGVRKDLNDIINKHGVPFSKDIKNVDAENAINAIDAAIQEINVYGAEHSEARAKADKVIDKLNERRGAIIENEVVKVLDTCCAQVAQEQQIGVVGRAKQVVRNHPYATAAGLAALAGTGYVAYRNREAIRDGFHAGVATGRNTAVNGASRVGDATSATVSTTKNAAGSVASATTSAAKKVGSVFASAAQRMWDIIPTLASDEDEDDAQVDAGNPFPADGAGQQERCEVREADLAAAQRRVERLQAQTGSVAEDGEVEIFEDALD